MKNWKIYLLILLTYILMQFGSIPLSKWLINYFHEGGMTEKQASFQGVAWGLFISNLIAAPIILWLSTLNKKFWEIRKGNKKKASIGGVILWGVLGFFMAMAGQMIAAIIETAFGVAPGSENTALLGEIAKASPIIILSIVVFAPLLEEIVFRRVVFGGIYLKTNFWIAGILSGVVFSLVHQEPQHLLIYLAPGLIFAFLYSHTGRIWTSMLAHLLMNGFVTILQFNMDKLQELQDMQGAFIHLLPY
ncbi:CPBP family intramembrane glutamic endopeptidase [Sporosarcina sp. Te-1]|uniref:CPBP family intramembrane glutamic endopeptidase n=1 Tax=Sporosarcina sp. Te-1 TaxID=2818390 RepID=UPI001FB0F216|nr:type II CAAX endopeptidase family protein [Sporosarcina sp. Te-1]